MLRDGIYQFRVIGVTNKKILKAIRLHNSLVLVLPKDFVVEHEISSGDQFEAMWSSDSRIILYKAVKGGKVERERLAAIARIQKEIVVIEEAQEKLRSNSEAELESAKWKVAYTKEELENG